MFMRSLAVLCLALISAAAAAQLPAVDPPQTYRLLGPVTGTESRCVGSGDTPLCAVETLIACFARRDEALCQAVWPTAPKGAFFGEMQRWQAYWWSYRVAGVEMLGADEARISIAGRHCGLVRDPPNCRTTPAPPTSYRVRRLDGKWQVINWRAPAGDGAG